MTDFKPIIKKLDDLRRDEKFYLEKLNIFRHKLLKTRKEMEEAEKKLN